MPASGFVFYFITFCFVFWKVAPEMVQLHLRMILMEEFLPCLKKKYILATPFLEKLSYFYALNQRIEIWQRADIMSGMQFLLSFWKMKQHPY